MTDVVTGRDPNQTEPEAVPGAELDPYARPCTGARARLTREPVTERASRLGGRVASVWLDPAAIRAWQDELAGLRRYKASPPYCPPDSKLRHIANAWYPLAVVSLASKQSSAYLMRRVGRAATFGALTVGAWAMWPSPWPVWVPVVIAIWLIT